MCSFSGATCTSRVRHNADYVPYAKICFDLCQRVASLTLNCNGDFAIRAYRIVCFVNTSYLSSVASPGWQLAVYGQ